MNDVKSWFFSLLESITQEYCTKQRIMPHSFDKNDQIALNSIILNATRNMIQTQAGFKIIKEKYPKNIKKQSNSCFKGNKSRLISNFKNPPPPPKPRDIHKTIITRLN